MTDEQLKTISKKELRLLIKDLTTQRDDLLDKLGVLTSERDFLIENNKILRDGLEKSEKDRKYVETAKTVLEENIQRLTKELQLSTANKTVGVILESTWSDLKNTLRKIFRRSKK